MAYKTVKGTYDILPDKMAKVEHVEILFKHFLDLYGYKLMKTPIFENTAVFKKDNDTSDMVTKEMYTFSMNGKDFLTLRPEGTAGIIRSFIENKLYVDEMPVKLGYIEEMFRHERPQKGRQRQFTQLGIECLGEKNPMLDAEIIALGYSYLKTLGLNQIAVLLNTLGDNESRLRYSMALKEYFNNYANELCPDCKNRLLMNPLRILDCKLDNNKEFVVDCPKLKDYLSEESKAYFKEVLAYLDELNIPYEVNDRLVRGLDYYTDTVFEVVSLNPESGSQSTIFGGGRYDELVKELGGPEISGIGFAIGEERLIILGENENIFDEYKPKIDAYIIDMTNGSKYVLKLASLLRHNGYSCEMNYYKRSLKSQFKSSDRKNARFVLIIGEDEVKTGTISLKDNLNKTQINIEYDKIIAYLDELMEEEDA